MSQDAIYTVTVIVGGKDELVADIIAALDARKPPPPWWRRWFRWR